MYLEDWKPCTKVKHTELGAKIALSKIEYKKKKKRKYLNKRKECRAYFCIECQAYHLTSQKE